MPKFKVMATSYSYLDAIVEAKDAEEAYSEAQKDYVNWFSPGEHAADFQIHGDMIVEIKEEEDND